jgi:hypothetical protein
MAKRVLIFIFFLSIHSPIWAQMVGTPYMISLGSPDKIRDALASAGCSSCVAYDAASSTSLVEITKNEYSSIFSNLSGASTKGMDVLSSLSSLGTYNDMVGTGPNFSILPANSYIAAVSFATYNNCSGAIAITCASSLTAASTCLTGNSASLSWTAYEVKYFAVKRPTVNCGSNTFLGRISVSGTVTAAGKSTGSARYSQTNPGSCGALMSSPISWSPALQVIATTTKQL